MVMAPSGKMFDSVKRAVRCMEASNKYSAEQIEKAKTLAFMNLKSRKFSKIKQSGENVEWKEGDVTVPAGWKVGSKELQWVSDDPTVPAGWKVNQIKGAKVGILSPAGLPFLHRGQALQHMLNNGFPAEEVEEMWKCQEHEGWREHHALPEGWRIRDKAGRGNGTQAGIQILTPTGRNFDSSVKAIEHMKSVGYVDVESLREIFNSKHDWFGKNKLKMEKIKAQKVATKKPEKITRENKLNGWNVHPKLPAGWKIKIREAPSLKVVLLNEKRKRLSALAAIRYMRGSLRGSLVASPHFDEDDVRKLKEAIAEVAPETFKAKRKVRSEGQSDVGWMDHTKLPNGWKVRTVEAPTWRMFLKSREGSILSTLAAVRFMDGSPDYDEVDVKKIKELRAELMPDALKIKKEANKNEKKKMKPFSKAGWMEHDKLPTGWMAKEREGSVQGHSKVVFRLEGQSGTMGRLAAIKLMKSSAEYGPQDIAAIREVYLELGGKDKPEQGRETSKEVTSDKDKIKQTSKRGKKESTEDQWVSGDASVPAGWKISQLEERFGRRLQSPAGVECRNRGWALHHLVEQGAPAGELEEMRGLLEHEGWRELQGLPEGWRVRSTQSRSNPWQYMTPRGKFFHVLASARKYMQAYGECDFETPKLRKSARKEPSNNEDIQTTEKMEIKEDIKAETDEEYSGIHFMKSEECTEMKNELKLEETEKIEDVKMETEYYDFIDDNDFAEMKSEVKEEVKLEIFDNIDDLSTFDNLLQRNIGQ